MEEGTVLSDSLMSIATWAANNPGKGVDAMLKELAPVPEQEKATEEEVAQAMENSRIWFVICSGCPNRATSLFSPITLSAVQEPSPLKLLLPRRLPRKTETGREGPGRAGNGLRCTRKQKAASSPEAAAAREEASEENSVVTETKEFPSVPAEELPENNIPEEVSAKA